MPRLMILGALAVAGLAACAPDYIYRPTEHATAQLAESGLPAALYPVPTDRPRGEVKLATLGVIEREGLDYLVVRMVVRNNSDQAWRLNPRTQRLIFTRDLERQLGPALLGSSRYQGIPRGIIPARSQRTFDLYFPLVSKQDRDALENFQIAWGLELPSQLVTNWTSFRRREVETYAYPSYYGPGYYYGWGYAPLYPYTYYPPYYDPFWGPGFGGYIGPRYWRSYPQGGFYRPQVTVPPPPSLSPGRSFAPPPSIPSPAPSFAAPPSIAPPPPSAPSIAPPASVGPPAGRVVPPPPPAGPR